MMGSPLKAKGMTGERKMDMAQIIETQEGILCRQLIQTYLRNVEAYLSKGGHKVNNGLGQEHLPDERLMRFIEETAEIPEKGVGEHRSQVIAPLLSKRVVKPKDLPYNLGQAIKSVVRHYLFFQEFLICRSSWGCAEEIAKKKKKPIKHGAGMAHMAAALCD